MVDGVELLARPLVVSITTLSGLKDRHPPQRGLLSVSRIESRACLASTTAVGLGDADALDEIADRLGRHAAPAQAAKRRHPRIVPAFDMAVAKPAWSGRASTTPCK